MTQKQAFIRKTEQPLAYASLCVNGDGLLPSFWTRYFGLMLSAWRIKGEHWTTPSGQLSTHPAQTGSWILSSKHAVQSDLLNPHVASLLSRAALPRRDLPDVLADTGTKMRIFCYWDNYAGDRVPVIDAELERIVNDSGGCVEIDIYPQKHAFLHEDQ